MRKLGQWMPSWAWVILVVALAQSVVSLANRNVYTKDEVDVRLENIEGRQEMMADDIKWLVRKFGGTPSAKE